MYQASIGANEAVEPQPVKVKLVEIPELLTRLDASLEHLKSRVLRLCDRAGPVACPQAPAAPMVNTPPLAATPLGRTLEAFCVKVDETTHILDDLLDRLQL